MWDWVKENGKFGMFVVAVAVIIVLAIISGVLG